MVRIAPNAYDTAGLVPAADSLNATFALVEKLIGDGSVLAAATPGYGCSAEALFKMCLGNKIGVVLNDALSADELFKLAYGSFFIELADGVEIPQPMACLSSMGETSEAYVFGTLDETLDMVELQEAWEHGIEGVFPYRSAADDAAAHAKVEKVNFTEAKPLTFAGSIARPHVVIPVFPGTNCEYDTAHAFEARWCPKPRCS